MHTITPSFFTWTLRLKVGWPCFSGKCLQIKPSSQPLTFPFDYIRRHKPKTLGTRYHPSLLDQQKLCTSSWSLCFSQSLTHTHTPYSYARPQFPACPGVLFLSSSTLCPLALTPLPRGCVDGLSFSVLQFAFLFQLLL